MQLLPLDHRTQRGGRQKPRKADSLNGLLIPCPRLERLPRCSIHEGSKLLDVSLARCDRSRWGFCEVLWNGLAALDLLADINEPVHLRTDRSDIGLGLMTLYRSFGEKERAEEPERQLSWQAL